MAGGDRIEAVDDPLDEVEGPGAKRSYRRWDNYDLVEPWAIKPQTPDYDRIEAVLRTAVHPDIIVVRQE